ncbi:uncharacterized protein LOC135717518 [Ochlerotatus camptorhynchus]|uniref:uncharacterized protein LOC135717518 n=1 Tax=Ochlerotatus camptorhynchus TaxID=644619 RepID=UPI0031E135A1
MTKHKSSWEPIVRLPMSSRTISNYRAQHLSNVEEGFEQPTNDSNVQGFGEVEELEIDSEMGSEPGNNHPRESDEAGCSYLNVEFLNYLDGNMDCDFSDQTEDPIGGAQQVDYELDLEKSGDSSFVGEEVAGGTFSQEKLPEGLYGCWLLVAVRDFKGHSSGREIGKWGVAGNTPSEFLHQCWLMSQRFLKREVIFRCNESGEAVPVWGEENPQEMDFARFALFNDKANHRYYPVDKVTANILNHWKKKDIHLLLHVYSLSLSNRAVFKTVKDSLLEPESRDRAGAASNRMVDDLAKKLRDKHGSCWQAQYIAWMMWANPIFAADPCQRDSLIDEAPPAHLIKLFSTREQPAIRSIKRSFAMAHSVNAGYHDEVVVIRKTFCELEGIVQTLATKMEQLNRSIEALEIRDTMDQFPDIELEQKSKLTTPLLLAYADDILIICKDLDKLNQITTAMKQLLAEAGLEIHPEKSELLIRDPFSTKEPRIEEVEPAFIQVVLALSLDVD